jgi:hypothetical protein
MTTAVSSRKSSHKLKKAFPGKPDTNVYRFVSGGGGHLVFLFGRRPTGAGQPGHSQFAIREYRMTI